MRALEKKLRYKGKELGMLFQYRNAYMHMFNIFIHISVYMYFKAVTYISKIPMDHPFYFNNSFTNTSQKLTGTNQFT